MAEAVRVRPKTKKKSKVKDKLPRISHSEVESTSTDTFDTVILPSVPDEEPGEKESEEQLEEISSDRLADHLQTEDLSRLAAEVKTSDKDEHVSRDIENTENKSCTAEENPLLSERQSQEEEALPVPVTEIVNDLIDKDRVDSKGASDVTVVPNEEESGGKESGEGLIVDSSDRLCTEDLSPLAAEIKTSDTDELVGRDIENTEDKSCTAENSLLSERQSQEEVSTVPVTELVNDLVDYVDSESVSDVTVVQNDVENVDVQDKKDHFIIGNDVENVDNTVLKVGLDVQIDTEHIDIEDSKDVRDDLFVSKNETDQTAEISSVQKDCDKTNVDSEESVKSEEIPVIDKESNNVISNVESSKNNLPENEKGECQIQTLTQTQEVSDMIEVTLKEEHQEDESHIRSKIPDQQTNDSCSASTVVKPDEGQVTTTTADQTKATNSSETVTITVEMKMSFKELKSRDDLDEPSKEFIPSEITSIKTDTMADDVDVSHHGYSQALTEVKGESVETVDRLEDNEAIEIAATPTPSRNPDPGGVTNAGIIHITDSEGLPAQSMPNPVSRYDDGAWMVVPESPLSAKYNTLTPFTEQQLRTFYYNQQLDRKDALIDHFLQEMNQEKHEFYELVLNYYRATNLHVSAEQDIHTLEKEADKQRELVWSETEHQLAASGHCKDNVKVSTVYTYYKAVVSMDSCNELAKSLKQIRSNVHDSLSLHAYTVQLSRLQVESYIHDLYNMNPALSNIPPNAPVIAMEEHERSTNLNHQVEALKSCISVLFMFQRRPAKDKQFFHDTREWLTRMVATLLRLATLEEHLFLLNQLLHCPSGVGKWAGQFLQLLTPCYVEGQSCLGSVLLDHFITMLATLMVPPRKREELLYRLKVQHSEQSDQNPWVLVDSDGEEDEDTENAWVYLHENDLVTLLNQFPLDAIFRHALLVRTDYNGADSYLIQRTSEQGMIRLFAFATCLIRILAQGLNTFSLSRYRQLNKRVARMIRHTVQYVSDHWLNYQSMLGSQQPELSARLHLEYDQVFLRATHNILAAQKLGSWQFMTDMPYKSVTMATMWKLVWLMHNGYRDNTAFSMTVSVEECKQMMKDASSKAAFEDQLMAMPMSEAIYLLTTFANMARSRSEKELDFVEAVTLEIFEISYVSSHSREFCSKVGRQLLAAIATDHPVILSTLLACMKHNLDKIGVVCLYLVRELPFELWSIGAADMTTLHHWVLNKELSCVESQLARAILARLNWGFDEQALNLKLDVSAHRQMALLLVEGYNKHVHGKQSGNFLTESLRQVASVVTGSKISDEQQFSQWAWDITLKLHLHGNTQPRPVLGSPNSQHLYASQLPDLNNDASLHGLAQGVRENIPIACYMAIVMTKAGHSTADFIADGLAYLNCLVTMQHYVPAVYALSFVTPLFYESPEYLSKNDKFLTMLQALLAADQSRLPRSIFAEFPGTILKFFNCMIQHQIHLSHIPSALPPSCVMRFWLSVLTSIKTWYLDRCNLYVVDSLLKSTFRCKDGQEMAHNFFSELYKKLVKVQKEQNVLSSLVSWISSGHALPSFIEQQSAPEFSWLAYFVLWAESEHEEVTTLWPTIQKDLLMNPNMPVEQALKKSATSLHLEVSPSASRLCVYRWAHQAVDMHLHRAALPLVWQQFFRRYLARLSAEQGLPERGSVGERFFESMGNTTLLKRMKKRLNEASDYHHKLATNSGENEDDSTEQNGLLEQTKYSRNQEFHSTLVKFYQTLGYWLDEPRLHDSKLYLPALPPQYQADRLLTVFQNQKAPWLDVVDWERVDYELAQLASEWTTHTCKHVSNIHKVNDMQEAAQPDTATKRILERLRRHTDPAPPPSLVPLKAPVPEVQVPVLLDKSALLYSLRPDYDVLTDYAKLFALRVSKHVHLDMTYTELLPELYKNEKAETRLEIVCRSSFSIGHKCSGPAMVNVQYDCKQRDDVVSRKLDENRAEYKQVMIESFLPPPQMVCGAAVHVENAITKLIKLHQSPPDAASYAAAVESGTALFYQMASNVSDETKYYPPTRQFFSSCIEILGQEFIRNNPEQSQPLLQAILKMPSLAGLLSPNFCPNTCPELFVTMYEDVLQVIANQGADLAFVLLTKFDVDKWLQKNKPALSQRSFLIGIISRGLNKCGLHPQESNDNCHLVFEMYRQHLKKMVSYLFPNHYPDILKLLLKGSTTKSLSADCWWDFLSVISRNTDDNKSEDSFTKNINPQLSLSQLKDTVEYMSSYFMRQRTSDTNSASFGLYPHWHPYVRPLATFLRFVNINLVTSTINEMSEKGGTPQIALDKLWGHLLDSFSPWIQPLNNNGQVLSPWIERDAAHAEHMVLMFVQSVNFLLSQFEGLLSDWHSDGVLVRLWSFYCERLAGLATPEHVLHCFHKWLLTLPWSKLCLPLPTLDLMLKIGRGDIGGHSCVMFLSSVFTRLEWPTIIQHYSSTSPRDTHQHYSSTSRPDANPELVQLHVSLLHLLVIFGSDIEIMGLNKTEMEAVFGGAEQFDWQLVDAQSYKHIVECFLHRADVRCVLLARTDTMALVLSLLKMTSGFVHYVEGGSVHPETAVKRALFVRCVVQMLIGCSHLKDVDPESFRIILTNLLTEIEAVAGTVVDTYHQQQEAVAMTTEVLNLLNSSNTVGGTVAVTLSTLREWVASSPTSLLLASLITAVCRTLASVQHMVVLTECCIDAHFSSDADLGDFAGWSRVLSALQIPELTKAEFLAECESVQAYLTLHAYVLQILPLSHSLQQEAAVLSMLISWNAKTQPRQENEAKLFLWWSKILELALRQVEFGANHRTVVQNLQSFIASLLTLGEDKVTTGLLGAIGLGKRSLLTLSFRLTARSLATFIQAQIPNENVLRIVSNAPGAVSNTSHGQRISASSHAVQMLAHLDSLKTNKHYSDLRAHLSYAVNFISNPAHSLRDGHMLLSHMATQLYPNAHCLRVLQLSTT